MDTCQNTSRHHEGTRYKKVLDIFNQYVFLYYKHFTLSTFKFEVLVTKVFQVWLKNIDTGTYLHIFLTNGHLKSTQNLHLIPFRYSQFIGNKINFYKHPPE